MLGMEPENGIMYTENGKKRVLPGEKIGFVTRSQDTKQSSTIDVLASFLCLKSFSENQHTQQYSD